MSHIDGCERCVSLLAEVTAMRIERDAARENAANQESHVHALRREIGALRQSFSIGTDRLELHPTESQPKTSAIASRDHSHG